MQTSKRVRSSLPMVLLALIGALVGLTVAHSSAPRVAAHGEDGEHSHFRGGDMWATINEDGEVHLFAKTRWRKGPAEPFPFGGIEPFQQGAGSGFNNNSNNFAYLRVFRVNPNGSTTLVVDWTTFRNQSTAGTTALAYLDNTTLSKNTSDPTFNERLQLLIIPFGTTNPQGRVVNALDLDPGHLYSIEWADCARVQGIRNHSFALSSGTCAPNQHYGLRTRIIWDETARSSPQFNSDIIVGVGRGSEYAQNLNAFHPGGESLAYAFSPLIPGTPFYGPTSRLPGGALDQFGNFRIPGTSTATLADNPSNPGADYMEKFIVQTPSGELSERDIMLDAVDRTPPELDSIGGRTVRAGETITFAVTGRKGASGASQIALRHTLLPAGATFAGGEATVSDTATGSFSWTPVEEQVGTHGVNFEVVATYASPPQLADSEFIQITVVSANHPPVLEQIANLRVGADPLEVEAFASETRVFDARATDPNTGDILTYSLPILINPSGDLVPLGELGVHIENTTDELGHQIGRITVQPGPDDVGVWQLRVRVDDGQGGSDEANVFISVGTFTNQSPVFDQHPPSEIFTTEGSTVSFSVVASDHDSGQHVTLSASSLPAGAVFTPAAPGNPTSATFSWTPGAGQAGSYTLFFEARDNGSPQITQRTVTRIHVAVPGPAPTRIFQLTPNEGPPAGGTLVTLHGQGFTGSVDVALGGNPVSDLVVVDSVTLTFNTPPGTEGAAVDVVVAADGGTDLLSGGFLYVTQAGPPEPPLVDLPEFINLANQHAVPLTIEGEAGTTAEFSVTDGTTSVTGSGVLDASGILSITLDLSGLADGLITATATLTAVGGTGDAGSDTATKDTESPEITAPADITVGTSDGATYVGPIGTATATDNVSSGAGLLITNDAPAAFPLGDTTVTWTATDEAGNSASATQVVTVVDDVAPEVTIDSAVDDTGAAIADGGSTISRTITFEFTATDNVEVTGFECSLDGEPFGSCGSGATYDELGFGEHVFRVRAADAGNVSLPAEFTWHIMTPAEAVGELTGVIENLDGGAGLGSQLSQTSGLLSDGNDANDAAVCGQLGAFLNQVDSQERRNRLTPEQAAELRRLANAIMTELGC